MYFLKNFYSFCEKGNIECMLLECSIGYIGISCIE